MAAKLIVTRDKLGAVLKAVKELQSKVVLVGVPGENAERKPVPGSKTAINNPTIGYLNEFGVPERNLPARPHLIPGIQRVQERLEAQLRKAGERALSLKPDAEDAGLHAAGLIAQTSVQKLISDRLAPPLSPKTLYRRRTRTVAPHQGDLPLLDTGAYRQSITYVIRRKSER